jgi:hypothetical protein
MGSAGFRLFKDLFLILIVIIFSKFLNPGKDPNQSYQDGLDDNISQNETPYDRRNYRKKSYNEDYYGVVDFGVIRSERNTFAQGSANYIGDNVYLTARHVVDGCDLSGVYHYPNSDLSLFRRPTNLTNDFAIKVSNKDNLDQGFILGFPSGKSAMAKIKYLGFADQKIRGDFKVDAQVSMWAFYDLSVRLRSLAGMSGGAVLDEYGDLIGVLSGEVVRRGRVLTTTINDTKGVIADNNIFYNDVKPDHDKTINAKQAYNYIASKKVIKITCENK